MPANSFKNKKLAQIFSIYNDFVPTKASVYLKTNLQNQSNSFSFNDFVAIDALNFSNRSDGTSIVYPDDEFSGFTEKGYLTVSPNTSNDDYQILSYPVKPDFSDTYNIWIRGQQRGSGNFKVNLYVNNNLESAINVAGIPSTSWNWYNAAVNLTGGEINTLGVQLNNDEITVDKIYILVSSSPPSENPTGEGPDLETSPYITLHGQLYNVSDSVPTTPLLIHDYKTTLNDILDDGWYNLSLEIIKQGVSYVFDDQFALVLFTSGSNSVNYLVWELVDSNEYEFTPIAEKEL